MTKQKFRTKLVRDDEHGERERKEVPGQVITIHRWRNPAWIVLSFVVGITLAEGSKFHNQAR
ncbi:MAG: hypothetical protein NUW37_07910 [Planctomycetes bacterium]|nr:hypothetical protein [Planctomycetota bacterium]